MKLDTNTINKIAKLARIRLSEEETKDLLRDMNSILDWVEQLNEVNTEAVEPLANISSSILPQRKDEAKDINSTDEILKNSPDKLEGYFAVIQNEVAKFITKYVPNHAEASGQSNPGAGPKRNKA